MKRPRIIALLMALVLTLLLAATVTNADEAAMNLGQQYTSAFYEGESTFFYGYRANGVPVDRGEPVRGEIISPMR